MVIAVWTIAILLALVGTAMLAYSAWKPIRRWRRRGKACVQCGYPRPSGENAPARCPECGTEYDKRTPCARLAMRSATALTRVAAGILPFTPLLILLMPQRASPLLEPIFVSFVESSQIDLGTGTYIHETRDYRTPALMRAASELRAFKVHIGRDLGLQRATIVDRKGCVAFTIEGWKVSIGSPIAPGDRRSDFGTGFTAFKPDVDIDSDHVPDVIVSALPRRGRGLRYVVLSLTDPPVVTVELVGSVEPRFDLVPGTAGNTTLITTLDTSWASSAWSYGNPDRYGNGVPKPIIAFRLAHGRVEILASAMRRPVPMSAVLAAKTERVRRLIRQGTSTDGVARMPTEYWTTAIDLLYTGHEDMAWKFLDDAWPEDVEGKAAFLAQFRQQLDRSPYWNQVRAAFAAEP